MNHKVGIMRTASKIAPVVQILLKNNPELANDSRKLCRAYAQYKGLFLSDEQAKIWMRMPAFETITRTARKLIETGDVQITKTARSAKQKRAQEFREEMKTWTHMIDPITGERIAL